MTSAPIPFHTVNQPVPNIVQRCSKLNKTNILYKNNQNHTDTTCHTSSSMQHPAKCLTFISECDSTAYARTDSACLPSLEVRPPHMNQTCVELNPTAWMWKQYSTAIDTITWRQKDMCHAWVTIPSLESWMLLSRRLQTLSPSPSKHIYTVYTHPHTSKRALNSNSSRCSMRVNAAKMLECPHWSRAPELRPRAI